MMVSERVRFVFRARSLGDNRALARREPLHLVAEASSLRGPSPSGVLVVASGWFGRHVRRIALADVQGIVPRERRVIVTDLPRTAGARRA